MKLADTFPNAVLESLACGTPVVATAVGGIPEQVRSLSGEKEPTGVLVPPGNPEALAEALIELAEDRNRARRMGLAGRVAAKRGHDPGQWARQIETVYTEALARRGREPKVAIG